MFKLSDQVERKFVESFDTDEWEVLTDTGYHPITSTNKTIKYQIHKVVLSNGYYLECADTHIVFDEIMNEKFVKDLNIGDLIQTDIGLSCVKEVSIKEEYEHMYDISVESEDHRYFTNGILSHNTQTTAAILLHQLIFNNNYTIAILANKASQAREIMSRLQLMYELLPPWLQHGVKIWNKGDIELENGSKAFSAATSPSAIRGKSVNVLYMDEIGHVDANKAEDFFVSSYPTVSSGKNTKIIMTSTPNGYNLFWRFWDGAEKNTNGFTPVRAEWDEHPKRDQAWLEDQRKVLGELKTNQEIFCSFLGSSNTLVSGHHLSRISTISPIFENENLQVFKEPIKSNAYMAFVDVSRGLLGDFSTLTVVDITKTPYEVVAKYKSNEITPLLFPSVIRKICEDFNSCPVLIELNDAGEQVANILYNDLEYENLIFTYTEKSKQIPCLADSKDTKPGVKTSKTVKSIGCSQLKILIEENKLLINDPDILAELSTFVEQKGSYAADYGYHDDLVMTLVLFGWLTSTELFKLFENESLRKNIYDSREKNIQDNLSPFGFIDKGNSHGIYQDGDGYTWEAKSEILDRDEEIQKIKERYSFDPDFESWFNS